MAAGGVRGAAGLAAGAEGAHHRRRTRGRGTDAGGRQRLADGTDDQPAHQARIAEANVGLGRMHVDVDEGRIDLEEQRGHRMAVAWQNVGIGAANGPRDQLVAHRPAVDMGILGERAGASEGRNRDQAGEPHPFPLGVKRDRVVGELAAHHLGDAPRRRLWPRLRGEVERVAVAAREREAHLRKGDRDALDDVGDGIGLGLPALHELQPRGRGEEEVAHLHQQCRGWPARA